MNQQTPPLSKIPTAALRALVGSEEQPDVEVFLPGSTKQSAVLYRKAGAGLEDLDFDKLQSNGVSYLYLQPNAFDMCERLLECKFESIVANSNISCPERAQIVQSTGTWVARELTAAPSIQENLHRTSKVIDGIVCAVLGDSEMSAHLLHMASHERSTASHMVMVSTLAVILGHEIFGSDQRILRVLGQAGMMHDLGKLSVPKEILNQRTALTREELALIQQHPIESVRLLGDDPNIEPGVRQIILQHHERLDGRGYPLGLKGDEILPETRVLAIVDSFHALIGRRAYRTSIATHQANRMLTFQANKQFDANFLRIWTDLCVRFSEMASEPPPPPASTEVEEDDHSVKHEHRPNTSQYACVEQRQKRYHCNRGSTVRCKHVGRLYAGDRPQQNFRATVQDLSRGGIGLLTDHPLYRGEVVNVELQVAGSVVWVQCQVAWCRQRELNAYKTGLRFVQRISTAEVEEITDIYTLESLKDATLKGGNAGKGPVRRDKRQNDLQTLDALSALRSPSSDAQDKAVALSSSADSVIRVRAADVLAGMNTAKSRHALLAMLNDANAEVREMAVKAVGQLGIKESLPHLRVLLRDTQSSVALRAAGSMGKLGDMSGMKLILDVLDQGGVPARLAATVAGELTGQKFGPGREGIAMAKRYLVAKKLVTV